MKRATTVLILAALLAPGGCAPEGDAGALWVWANAAVTARTQCQVKASGTVSEVVSIGTMDLLLTNRYYLFPILEFGMPPVEKATGQMAESGHNETHVLSVKGAWVSYEIDGLQGPYDGKNPQGKATKKTALYEAWVPTSGALKPDENLTVTIEVVPPWIGELLDRDKAFDHVYSGGYLIATVILEGTLIDGTVVHSATFDFPIIACRGCLVGYDPDLKVTPTEGCCFPGQNEPLPMSEAQLLLYTGKGDRWEKKLALLKGEIASLAEDLPAGWTPTPK